MNGAFIFISVSTTNNCIISVSVNVKSTVISFSRGIMRVNHWCVYFSAMILFCFLVERLSRQTQWMNVLTFLWKNTLHPVAWTTSPRSWACTRSTWSPSWGASSTCCAWTAPFLYRTGTTSPSWCAHFRSCVHVTLSSFSPSPDGITCGTELSIITRKQQFKKLVTFWIPSPLVAFWMLWPT